MSDRAYRQAELTGETIRLAEPFAYVADAVEQLGLGGAVSRVLEAHGYAVEVMLGVLRFAHMGRTFYPEQPSLEPIGLIAEDDAGQV